MTLLSFVKRARSMRRTRFRALDEVCQSCLQLQKRVVTAKVDQKTAARGRPHEYHPPQRKACSQNPCNPQQGARWDLPRAAVSDRFLPWLPALRMKLCRAYLANPSRASCPSVHTIWCSCIPQNSGTGGVSRSFLFLFRPDPICGALQLLFFFVCFRPFFPCPTP